MAASLTLRAVRLLSLVRLHERLPEKTACRVLRFRRLMRPRAACASRTDASDSMEVTIQTQEVRVFTTEMRRRRVQRVCRR